MFNKKGSAKAKQMALVQYNLMNVNQYSISYFATNYIRIQIEKTYLSVAV